MRRILHAALLTTSLTTLALAGMALTASAQMDQSDQGYASISFDAFQDQLAPHGWWLYSDRWGVVWQPSEVQADFRPYYTDGRWLYTDDYGWYWQSDYAWGDIPFHYGRWVNDPDDGWLWIPGYVWSPGWVVWRSNPQYIGWMPMPPDDAFLEGRGDIGLGVSYRFGPGEIGGFYGYSRWYGPSYDESRFAQNWVFVGAGQIMAPDYRLVAIRQPERVINIIHQTRNITNYTIVNNFVVNRSLDVHVVERAAGHPIAVVHAATVIRHPDLVASVAVGQRVQVRMRTIAPRGRGVANSAPPPPPHVVAKLSTNATPRNGRASVHLFTKSTVQAPEAQARFHGPAVRGPGAAGPGEMQSGPERPREVPPGARPEGLTEKNAERPGEAQPGMTRPSESPREVPSGAGPGAATGPTAEHSRETQPGMEHPRETPPGGMTGPNSERPREAPPGAEPAGASRPSPERPREVSPGTGPAGAERPTTEAPRELQPGGGPNGMMGPGAERPRQAPPGGATAPAEGPRPQPPAARERAPAQPNAENPPKKPAQPNAENPPKKKEPPPQNPPG